MRTLSTILILLLFFSTFIAQDDLAVEKQVGPATYPPAARAVRAHGEVVVEASVGPDGMVLSATALTGHPLLKATSAATAKDWQFSKSANSVAERKVNLFFSYSLRDWVHIPASETRSEDVLRHDFTSPFSVHSIYETLIPRLLILPRSNGEIRTESCPLHKQQVNVETQRVICRRTEPEHEDDEIVRLSDYGEAENSLFPNANVRTFNECNEIDIEQAEIQFCNACRDARAEWIRSRREATQ